MDQDERRCLALKAAVKSGAYTPDKKYTCLWIRKSVVGGKIVGVYSGADKARMGEDPLEYLWVKAPPNATKQELTFAIGQSHYRFLENRGER